MSDSLLPAALLWFATSQTEYDILSCRNHCCVRLGTLLGTHLPPYLAITPKAAPALLILLILRVWFSVHQFATKRIAPSFLLKPASDSLKKFFSLSLQKRVFSLSSTHSSLSSVCQHPRLFSFSTSMTASSPVVSVYCQNLCPDVSPLMLSSQYLFSLLLMSSLLTPLASLSLDPRPEFATKCFAHPFCCVFLFKPALFLCRHFFSFLPLRFLLSALPWPFPV